MHNVPLASTTVTLASFLRRSSGNTGFKGSVASSAKKQLNEY